MNKSLFRKLALQNIKNNKNTFAPFMICVITMVALFYMLSSINYQVAINKFYGAETMKMVLKFGEVVCGLFAFCVIFYTNSFLMKKRSKELGLYSMLGMDKKHIGKVLFWENTISGLSSIVLGLVVGVTFSKLAFMLLENMLHLNTGIKFAIVKGPFVESLVVFIGVFCLIIIRSFIRVFRLKPIELMRDSKVGERELRANWVIAILGIVCLGIGYYLAVTTANPVKALMTFFIAVLFVIVGTYFIFISGMVALLKLLKSNKNIFYNKKNFVTISGLIYRMKHNAVGLANICILSTAVLVVLFSTLSIYVGTEEVVAERYPLEGNITYIIPSSANERADFEAYDPQKITAALEKRADKYNVQVSQVKYSYTAIELGKFKDNSFEADGFIDTSSGVLYIQTLDDYNRKTGKNITLKDNEFLWYSEQGLELGELEVDGTKYVKAGELQEDEVEKDMALMVSDNATMVVKDCAALEAVHLGVNKDRENMPDIMLQYYFNLKGATADKEDYFMKLRKDIEKVDIPHLLTVDSIYASRQEFINLYGSLFFIGIFIGLMFLITTVMIIYYKQISEGYEDREKFSIMKKVGMSDREIKSTIKRQILMVFFIPIILAVIHIGFAFGAIQKIMVLFGITRLSLLVGCFGSTVLIYLLFYGFAYALTARSYYKAIGN